MITPDFLFAVLALVYFIILLQCFRQDRLQDWFSLGVVHGLAFLAKAFALPWLAVCTLLALGLSAKPWRTRVPRLGLAALIPVMVAASWATVLHSKYGVFTTGTQLRVNLLQWTLRAYDEHSDTTYALLRDTRKDVDEYGVIDPMPPGSWPWTYPLSLRQVLPRAIRAEARNVPRVLKEMMIVATLGGLTAFVAMLVILTRRRHQYPVEWRFAVVVAVAALSLISAYSMLVFDGRYLFPLIPLVLAIAARFLIPDSEFGHDRLRKLTIALVALGVIASLVYPSSPYRLLTRDFQASCYDADNRLRAHPGSGIVSIGAGPFPEHGVGWEAGYKASFFAGRRIIGAMDSLPAPAQLSTLAGDMRKASPDTILVWGKPDDPKYTGLIQNLMLQYPQNSIEKIVDPVLGEVGIVLWKGRRVAHSLRSFNPFLSWQSLFHVSQSVGQHGHGGGVFAEFGGDYFVEGVGGGVVVVEIGATVLEEAEGGDSGVGHGGDVGAGSVGGGLEDCGSDALENGLDGAEGVEGGGRGFYVEAQRVGGAGVAFYGGCVVGEIIGVIGGVGAAAGASGFFVHPGDYAESAGGAQVEALEEFGGLHGDYYAGSVVDGSGAEVPGIQVSGDYYDLFGMFGTFQVGDYVVTGFVRKLLGCQNKPHADFALG
jgi:hypothetical protein